MWLCELLVIKTTTPNNATYLAPITSFEDALLRRRESAKSQQVRSPTVLREEVLGKRSDSQVGEEYQDESGEN